MYRVYKYNALTEEEIIMAVSRLDEEHEVEDDELIEDEPAVPSHSEAYASVAWGANRQWSSSNTCNSPVRQLQCNSVGNKTDVAVHN